ncbi:MAG: DUF3987 domain-containing protein [Acidobacteriaceae bacterium]|nr:DUF3987 domain-containing protein [Acidobacteriaceae bacterium]
MAPAAFYGIAGEFVRLVLPHTEAHPAALLVSALTAIGNFTGRDPYYLADGSRHYVNEFVVIVGQTAKARKGTSLKHVENLLDLADHEYVQSQWKNGGLSSGEGLIYAIRDGHSQDKRVLIVEGEFSRVLQNMQRQGNTLSGTLRDVYDNGRAGVMTKNHPVTASDAHVSVVGHITREEVTRVMNRNECWNGFGNRFLWIFVPSRSKSLPHGGNIPANRLGRIAARLRQARLFSQNLQRIKFDDGAAKAWEEAYDELSEGHGGLVGALISRSEAHAVRLATLFAVLDLSHEIKVQHLQAALAIVDYSNRSVAHIFGDQNSHSFTQQVLTAVRNAGTAGLTKTDLMRHFSNNKSSDDIRTALDSLRKQGLIWSEARRTEGRSSIRWFHKAAAAPE